MFKKNRSHARKSLSNFGFILVFGDDGGQILNISDSGLCFQTFSPLGDVRNLQFWFSLNLRDRVEANGRVAWLNAETNTGGLSFVNLSERAIKHIRAHATGACEENPPKKGKLFATVLAKYRSSQTSVEKETHRPEVAASEAVFGTSQGYGLFEEPVKASPASMASVESTELIPLQRHIAVCRRHMILGILLGVLVSSVVGIFLTAYSGYRSRGTRASVEGTHKTTNQSDSIPAQSVLSATSGPPSAPPASLRELQSPARNASYADSPAATSRPQYPSPFSEENGNYSQASKTSQSRGGTHPALRVSTATPQQLWSAVQAGDSNAAVVLADRYLRGDGVPTNCLQARVLLLAASEKNNAIAARRLHELDKSGCH